MWMIPFGTYGWADTDHPINKLTNNRVLIGEGTEVGGRRAGVRTQDSEDERMDEWDGLLWEG